MDHIPKLSVLITSHNDGKFISQCLDSILRQTFQDFEIIIVDDESKDNTVEIIKSYRNKDSRIKLLCNEKNIGLARSLNKGMQYCRADLIVRQDADDYSVLTRFEEQLNYLNKYPELVLLGTQEIWIDEDNCKVESTTSYPAGYENIYKTLTERNCFQHSSVMFKKNAVLNAGGYRPFPACQDYDLWVRVAQHQKADNLDNKLIYHRLSRSSISFKHIETQTGANSLIQKLARQRFKDGYDVLDGFKEQKLEENILLLINKEMKLNKKICSAKNIYYFEHVLKTSGKRDALPYLLRALKLNPFNPNIVRLFMDNYVSENIWIYIKKIKIIFTIKDDK